MFMAKTWSKTYCYNLTKGNLKKSKYNMILNGKRLNDFPTGMFTLSVYPSSLAHACAYPFSMSP